MPKYYFNIVYPGEFIRDHYGHELPNLTAAQDQAFNLAQRMLGQGQHWHWAMFHIVSEGQEVATVPFSVVDSTFHEGNSAYYADDRLTREHA